MAKGGEKLLYFLIGGFVGASVALLFAPKSGEETRQLLGDRYRSGAGEVTKRVQAGREFVSSTRQNLSDSVSSTIDKGRDAVNKQKEQISSAIEAGKRAYQEEKGKLETGDEENG
ncbi:MAG: YtxH domain-containing protein [Acidobacteriota bacterium]|jgi:gas vesicle protein